MGDERCRGIAEGPGSSPGVDRPRWLRYYAEPQIIGKPATQPFRSWALHNPALRIIRERQKHVQRQPAHRCAAVKLLRHRDEAHSLLLEHPRQPHKVEQRATEAIHL